MWLRNRAELFLSWRNLISGNRVSISHAWTYFSEKKRAISRWVKANLSNKIKLFIFIWLNPRWHVKLIWSTLKIKCIDNNATSNSNRNLISTRNIDSMLLFLTQLMSSIAYSIQFTKFHGNENGLWIVITYRQQNCTNTILNYIRGNCDWSRIKTLR